MIEDARVLREDFIPSEVVHRDAEITALSRVLEPLTDGEPADTAILTGPSGAGKTCLAQFAVDRLKQEVLDLSVQYVNCWQNYSRFRVLYRVLEGLGKTIDIHRGSTPNDELIERLRTHETHCLIVLDEVDQLQDTAVLYDLHQLPHVSTILIANREAELFAAVGDRLTSRLAGSTRIQFDRYAESELVSIMDHRARWGLTEGAIDPAELRRIADVSAGDARVALGILRNAARTAQYRGRERISASIVDESIPDARRELHRKNLDTLTPDQRAVYDVIDESGPISPGELYDAYRARVDDPRTDRTVRNYLSKMRQYDLIESRGESRDREYDVV
ncbi:MAG: Cdc6/Cdc18 family protein [Halobacteriota archaeon]